MTKINVNFAKDLLIIPKNIKSLKNEFDRKLKNGPYFPSEGVGPQNSQLLFEFEVFGILEFKDFIILLVSM